MVLIGLIIAITAREDAELIILLRVPNISRMYKKIEIKLNISYRQNISTQLFKLLGFLLIIAHFTACLFRVIANFETEYFPPEQIWTFKVDIYSKDLFNMYINSLYWAVETMVTLGYGDIVPITVCKKFIIGNFNIILKDEKLYLILVVLGSCGIFGYSLNLVGELIKEMERDKQKFKEQIEKVEIFMKRRHLNVNLRNKVRKNFSYQFKQASKEKETSDFFLNQMHLNLKDEVCLALYNKILINSKVISLNFSPILIQKMCHIMKEKVILAQEFLQVNIMIYIYLRHLFYYRFKVGEPSSELYFLLEGKSNFNFLLIINLLLKACQIFDGPPQIELETLEGDGKILGHRGFFSQNTRNSSIKVLNQATVAYVEFSQFYKLLKLFPDDYEKFCFLKDNLNLYQKSSGLEIKCFSCFSYDHQLSHCNSVQFIPQLSKIIASQNSIIQKDRIQFQRKNNPFRIKNYQIQQQQILAYRKEKLEDSFENNDQQSSQLSCQNLKSESLISTNNMVHQENDPSTKQSALELSPKRNKQKKVSGLIIQTNQLGFSSFHAVPNGNFQDEIGGYRIRSNSKELYNYKQTFFKKSSFAIDDKEELGVQGQCFPSHSNNDLMKVYQIKDNSGIGESDYESEHSNKFKLINYHRTLMQNQKNEKIPSRTTLDTKEFDIMGQLSEKYKSYNIYFPHNNLLKVINNFESLRKKTKQYQSLIKISHNKYSFGKQKTKKQPNRDQKRDISPK